MSIGIRAAWQSIRLDRNKRAGFTLLEALVALTLVLVFAVVLGPHLFQARLIMTDAQGKVAAQVLLRSLLEAPLDRAKLAEAREGVSGRLRWRVVAEPILVAGIGAATEQRGPLAPQRAQSARERTDKSAPNQPSWTAFRVVASVFWDRGQVFSAETMRLGKVQ
ncbi:MAG: type II secretion system protein [Xanthobacteraceae bacterium]